MRTWLRPLPFLLATAYVMVRFERAPVFDAAPSREDALCASLAHAGLACSANEVVWVEGTPSRGSVRGAIIGDARAIVRARDKEDVVDLWAVDARLSPEGQLLDVQGTWNLSHSTGAEESVPILSPDGARAAYVVRVGGHPEAVHVLDLAGHAPEEYAELSRAQRLQVKLAALQATGRLRGVKKTVYALVNEARDVAISFREDGQLEIRADARTLLVDRSGRADTTELRLTPEVLAKPPTFAPWMSDRLRAASWFGDEKNQALKAIIFTALEWAKGQKAALTGDTGEKEATEDLASIGQDRDPGATRTYVDPEIGWPPAPLVPMANIRPKIAAEGQWVSLEGDPFITPFSVPGIGAPFVTTFVRTDPSAVHTRVYVTMWDPRLVSLHMQAGTIEPVSATGEAGSGRIPRVPEVINRVVAGFNGGFQATHGQFGMQADGVLYLPPKGYAATVLELRDGATGFGAWPPNLAEVPVDVVSFRQNMTPLAQDGKYNPWARGWWGGVPPGWHDAVHTTRSGLCLTKEGYVGYFWGSDIGPEPLGRAMLVARCDFGMHLDMNPGLAGFEFYNMRPPSSPLARPMQSDWEVAGTVKDMPEVAFRARRMIKSMGHIQFPRYIGRDGRDFFYLLARPLLPGAPLDAEHPFRVRGLPQHGFPYAIAIAETRLPAPSGKLVRVLRVDPRMVTPKAGAGAEGDVVLAIGGGKHSGATDAGTGSAGDGTLSMRGHVFAIGPRAAAGEDAETLELAALALPGPNASAPQARGAAGISDEDGMLQWVELAPEEAPDAATSAAMLDLLRRLGCSTRGLQATPLRAYPGGTADLAAAPAVPAETRFRFLRARAPAARAMFTSTPIVPPSIWQPVQSKRVTWRPTLAPPEKPDAGAPAGKKPGAGVETPR